MKKSTCIKLYLAVRTLLNNCVGNMNVIITFANDQI